ncbi:hypothetical protein [Ilumatobacter sp.]|uniref:hypothetical protein n=1 Tax=Ilumatobacter sp. TaxID=1967498 RepID=UPI003C4AD53E
MTAHHLAVELVSDEAIDHRIPAEPWNLPWHRIRLDDGRPVSRKNGAFGSDTDLNEILVDEGGDVRDGAATAACRFGLATVEPRP